MTFSNPANRYVSLFYQNDIIMTNEQSVFSFHSNPYHCYDNDTVINYDAKPDCVPSVETRARLRKKRKKKNRK